jgi:hypothetical protein
MTITDKVGIALSEWAFNVAAAVLPRYTIPQGSTIGNIMQGFFGMDPKNYNVWNELGFLAEPLIQTMVTPMVNRYLAGMSDEQVRDVVMKFAESFLQQAREKGAVNLFGIELGPKAFEGLKEILTEKLQEN